MDRGPIHANPASADAVQAVITLRVDGETRQLTVDTRTTLLDALRERLGNTSPKKGCDHGQCRACTVLLDGERALSCLALAVAYDGAEIITADGRVADVRLTLGGVAHKPWRAARAEEALRGGPATVDAFRAAAEAELAAAKPQAGLDGGNDFKVPLTIRTLVAVLRELTAEA